MSVELLAPVGSIESFYAAIENKADAVYLGGKQFGARAYADNFSNEEIKMMIDYAHLFHANVYVTINTIVFDDEIDDVIEFLDFLYLNQCDGIIVQDLGIANIVIHRYPNFKLHASTQMNIHSLAQVKTLKEIGFSRVVLAREVSMEEIIEIKKNVDIELEIFIHGALCVSHSGNCYFSSIVGKRSGNRGRCAQPCRLEYTVKDETGYLISPKDLCTIDRIDELLKAGIDSLKIEGRMKRPEYVAQVVKSYKEAIDASILKRPFDLESNLKRLEKIFNRSFTKGFLFNEKNNDFVNKEYSNHQGIVIGKVVFSSEDWVHLQLTDDLEKDDSIRIVGPSTDAITINQMYIGKTLVTKAKAKDIVRMKPHMGNLMGGMVLLTSSNSQLKELEESYKNPKRKIEITGKCFLEDDYLTLTISDGKNYVKEKTTNKVQPALKVPSNDRILEQLNKTAITVFEFKDLTLNINDPIFININEINDLRRRSLEKLKLKRTAKYSNREIKQLAYENIKEFYEQDFKQKVKVRNFDQLKAVLNYQVDEVYVTQKSLLSSIEELNLKEKYPNVQFKYFIPRINKKIIQENYELISSDLSILDGVTTSNYMNINNSYAVHFLEAKKVKTIGLSIELSIEKIRSLIYNHKKNFGFIPNLELMVYGRFELMMMKYCVVQNTIGCAGCKKEEVHLIDRKGFSFPILQEPNCSVKILNSKKLHLIEYIDEIKEMGIKNILLDFTNESYEDTMDVCDVYFMGKVKKIEDVTYGHFKEGVL